MIRAVLDTSILVRAVLRPLGSVGFIPRGIGGDQFVALYSEEMLAELAEVLGRPRFRDKYGVRDQDVQTLIGKILKSGECIEPKEAITDCRDPKDAKFLEVAVEGQASVIVTGDEDLLVLDPFREIAIVGPSEFRRMLRKRAP